MSNFATIVPMHPTKRDGTPAALKYEPVYCEVVRTMAQEGKFPEEWCVRIGVTANTLYNWANKYPEFEDAMHIAWHLLASYWAMQARMAATGGIPGSSPTVLLALLQRRFPQIWGKNGGRLTQEHFETRNEAGKGSALCQTCERLQEMTEEQITCELEALRREAADLSV